MPVVNIIIWSGVGVCELLKKRNHAPHPVHGERTQYTPPDRPAPSPASHRCEVARVMGRSPWDGHVPNFEHLHAVRQPEIVDVLLHPLHRATGNRQSAETKIRSRTSLDVVVSKRLTDHVCTYHLSGRFNSCCSWLCHAEPAEHGEGEMRPSTALRQASRRRIIFVTSFFIAYALRRVAAFLHCFERYNRKRSMPTPEPPTQGVTDWQALHRRPLFGHKTTKAQGRQKAHQVSCTFQTWVSPTFRRVGWVYMIDFLRWKMRLMRFGGVHHTSGDNTDRPSLPGGEQSTYMRKPTVH